MFGVFSLGDGSKWFCAGCGASTDRTPTIPQLPTMMLEQIPHSAACPTTAHWRAIAALKSALQEAGIAG